MFHPPSRITWLAAVLLAACNTAPVIPPEDTREFELAARSLWSGGSFEVVVRHGEGEQATPRVTLDGTALVVTRVDDTTFSAALPVHTGTLPVRVEGEGISPLNAHVTLHGYLGTVLGPQVEGAMVVLSHTPPRVLGGTREGLLEVSLATAVGGRSWPTTFHDHSCGWGVLPGLATGTVILRARISDTVCADPVVARLGQEIAVETTLPQPPTWFAPVALVGPSTALAGGYDLVAQRGQCTGGFVACTWSSSVPLNHTLVGIEIAPSLGRAVTLAHGPALYDLATGDTVRSMPWIHLLSDATAAAFDVAEGVVYVSSATPGATFGGVHAVRTSDGALLVETPTDPEIGFRAVAVDAHRQLVLAAAWNVAADRLELRVFRRGTLEPVAVLPATGADVPPRLRYGIMRLVVDAPAGIAYLVSSLDFNWNPAMALRPMVIARWSLVD